MTIAVDLGRKATKTNKNKHSDLIWIRTLTTFFLLLFLRERGSKWRFAGVNVECWLGSFENFKGIRSSIAKKFYIFVFFSQMGGSGPPVPPLDPGMGPDNVYTY